MFGDANEFLNYKLGAEKDISLPPLIMVRASGDMSIRADRRSV